MILIIDIPEEDYRTICKNKENAIIAHDTCRRIANGTPLPKGHGDLIDRDKLVYDCSLDFGGCDRICYCKGCTYHIIREIDINKVPTIIEADKGE